MTGSFFRYFFHYIFFGRSKQRLLFLAFCGLTISSFALFVLQSTMQGLQRGLLMRSKEIQGDAIIYIKKESSTTLPRLLKVLKGRPLLAYPEYEIELLVRHSTYLSPVQVHAIDWNGPFPPFLKGDASTQTIIGAGILQRLHADIGSQINMISPSHTNSFLGDIPRQVSTTISSVLTSELSEIDDFHLWTRLGLIQNLTRSREINLVRIYSMDDNVDFSALSKEIVGHFGDSVLFKTFEEQNDSLIWSLNLETKVMLFLFVAMTCLVGIAITSGLLIFFGKIQIDLVSFWMLGVSRKRLERLSLIFINILSFASSCLGLALGGIFLFFLDRYSAFIMPDVFLEQKIPIYISLKGIIVSLMIPYLFASLFSRLSLGQFKKDQRPFMSQMRRQI